MHPTANIRRAWALGIAIALASACAPARAASPVVTLHFDPSATEIHYSVGGALHHVHGSFALKGGLLSFDPTTGVAEGQILVDAASGHSGDRKLDARMQAQVLESEKYPEIFFHPEKSVGRLKEGAEQHLTLIGSFNIHGGDHPLKVDAVATLHGDQATLRTEFDLPYVAWGMKDASTLLLRARQVHVSMVAHAAVEGAKGER